MNRSIIALFARAPVRGKVKTRLAKTHGDDFVFDMAEAMLADTLSLCAATEVEIRLFLTPDDSVSQSRWGTTTAPQGEDDLWTRLLRADARLRDEGFDRVVFVGSDAPDIPVQLLEAAFASLESRPLVVGPSLDGGFYLLGSARHLPDDLFEGVPISARDTLAHLTDNLHRMSRERDLTFRALTAWSDVDDDSSLRLFIERLQQRPESAPHSRKVLQRYEKI